MTGDPSKTTGAGVIPTRITHDDDMSCHTGITNTDAPNAPALPVATAAPQAPQFAPGDTVVFVNDYGVNWGERHIVGHRYDDVRGHVYQIVPTDTPWYEDPERTLFRPGDPAIIEAMVERPKLYRPDGWPWA